MTEPCVFPSPGQACPARRRAHLQACQLGQLWVVGQQLHRPLLVLQLHLDECGPHSLIDDLHHETWVSCNECALQKFRLQEWHLVREDKGTQQLPTWLTMMRRQGMCSLASAVASRSDSFTPSTVGMVAMMNSVWLRSLNRSRTMTTLSFTHTQLQAMQ